MDFIFNTIEVSDIDKSFNFYKDILNLGSPRFQLVQNYSNFLDNTVLP